MPEQEVVEGDAFEALEELPADYGDAAVVDYPWEFDGGGNRNGRFGSTKEDPEFTLYSTEDNHRLAEVLDSLGRVLEDGSWVYIFADDDTQPYFRELTEESPLTYRRTVVWVKENYGMGYYHRVQHYPIITATNGDTSRYVQDRGTVYHVPAEDGTPASDSDFATGKPTELYRQLLAPPVLKDDVSERLLEPFCGRAPGAAVASERSHHYWGCDINPEAMTHATRHLESSRLDDWIDDEPAEAEGGGR